MRIDFVTLFPEMVLPALDHSILKRAVEIGAVQFGAQNPRDFAEDKHRTVDDAPFGGGPGMVMRPDVVDRAISACLDGGSRPRVILTEPWGQRFNQSLAEEWKSERHLIFVTGHYEGIDGRVAEKWSCDVVSLGDFVLTGGELPALVMADAVVRLLPGVLGSSESLDIDSHSAGLLATPQYTRPWDWEGLTPPEVLKSGNHAAIERFRRQEALRLTRKHRPDLLATAPLEKSDVDLLY